MGVCDVKITRGEGFDCNISGGVEAKLTLFNFSDIIMPVRDTVNPQIITDLELSVITPAVPAGPSNIPPAVPAVLATGFLFQGSNTSVTPTANGVKKKYSFRFDHKIEFLVFNTGSATKKNLEALASGRVVAIIEHLNKISDSTFEIYGLDVGLILTVLTDDPNNADNEGAYAITIGSPDGFKEPHMPATFYDTDYATTRARLEELTAPNS